MAKEDANRANRLGRRQKLGRMLNSVEGKFRRKKHAFSDLDFRDGRATSTLIKANSLSKNKSRTSWPEGDNVEAKRRLTKSQSDKRKVKPSGPTAGLTSIGAAIIGAGTVGAGVGAANKAPPRPPKDDSRDISPEPLR